MTSLPRIRFPSLRTVVITRETKSTGSSSSALSFLPNGQRPIPPLGYVALSFRARNLLPHAARQNDGIGHADHSRGRRREGHGPEDAEDARNHIVVAQG